MKIKFFLTCIIFLVSKFLYCQPAGYPAFNGGAPDDVNVWVVEVKSTDLSTTYFLIPIPMW